MPNTVLDASALLALINSESGADVVAQSITEAAINAVNLSEVVGKLSTAGIPEKDIREALRGLDLEVIAFDEEQAYSTGLLRSITDKFGLSLGDRVCLDTARKLGVPALTADKMWGDIPLEIDIRLIR